MVDFTKDYSQIRQSLTKIEHFDKTSLQNILLCCNKQLSSNWGNQSYSQILLISDLGGGLGKNSIKSLINNINGASFDAQSLPLPLPFPSKISVMCLGNDDDAGFKYGKELSTSQSPNIFRHFWSISNHVGRFFYDVRKKNLFCANVYNWR